MKRTHAAFARAQKEVADARDIVLELPDDEDAVAGLHSAESRLTTAEKTVRREFDAAWQRNIDAVQAAKQRYVDAIQEQGRVEKAVGDAIAARTAPGQPPVIAPEERAQLDAAATETDAAIDAIREAEGTMKAGVTVEQLTG